MRVISGDMKYIHRLAAAFVLFFGIATSVASAPALALTTSTLITYHTQLTQVFPFDNPGAYLGTLRVAISPDGVASGFYLPLDGTPVPVSGGVSGDRIWLNLGSEWQVNGTVREGRIVGTARSQDGTTMDRFRFEASPQS